MKAFSIVGAGRLGTSLGAAAGPEGLAARGRRRPRRPDGARRPPDDRRRTGVHGAGRRGPGARARSSSPCPTTPSGARPPRWPGPAGPGRAATSFTRAVSSRPAFSRLSPGAAPASLPSIPSRPFRARACRLRSSKASPGGSRATKPPSKPARPSCGRSGATSFSWRRRTRPSTTPPAPSPRTLWSRSNGPRPGCSAGPGSSRLRPPRRSCPFCKELYRT